MASTTRSTNGRSKQAESRSADNAKRSMAAKRSPATSAQSSNRNGARSRSRSSSNASSRGSSKGAMTNVTRTIGSTAKKAKTPIVAGGAGVAGLAAGTALGALLRGSRRPRVLGMPMPRAQEMKTGAQKAVRAGRWFYDVQTDLRLLREHAEHSRRQSPIEVLLSGLTSRTLPRGR
jgi:hypothetical protein